MGTGKHPLKENGHVKQSKNCARMVTFQSPFEN